MTALRFLRALVLSSHPLPTAAVTAISAVLALLVGLTWERGLLVIFAVLTGQLSIGWSNDFVDGDRDRAATRADKPVAAGAIKRSVVGVAAVVALTSTVLLSVILGWPAGLIAIATVMSAWAYNLVLKATVLSWLPYAFSFGLAPAIVTLAAEPSRWPEAWVITAFALMGVAAHFANVLPDLRDDMALGVRGLPHRVGARATALGAVMVLLAASAVILLGPAHAPGMCGWAGLLVTVVITGVASRAALRDPTARQFFVAVIVIAGINLLAIGLAGTRL